MTTASSIFGENSTKGKVVELLSGKWPLTSKKIYMQLLKMYHLSITYQATHKALKELCENGILERRKEGYLLNKEWAKSLSSFGDKIREELEKTDENRSIKTVNKIVFDTHADFIKFHIGFMEELFGKDKKLDMLFYFRHVPSPQVLSSEDINKLKPLMPKIKWKIVSKFDMPLDRWNARYWKKFGVKVEFGKDIPTNSRVMLMNDYILNIISSKQDIEAWDESCSEKDISGESVHKITEGIINKKYRPVVTIMKDKEIASLLREMSD